MAILKASIAQAWGFTVGSLKLEFIFPCSKHSTNHPLSGFQHYWAYCIGVIFQISPPQDHLQNSQGSDAVYLPIFLSKNIISSRIWLNGTSGEFSSGTFRACKTLRPATPRAKRRVSGMAGGFRLEGIRVLGFKAFGLTVSRVGLRDRDVKVRGFRV